MKILKQILTWLSGKKSIIAGLITTTSAFLVSEGVITAEQGTFIASISLILFGSASYATSKIVYNK